MFYIPITPLGLCSSQKFKIPTYPVPRNEDPQQVGRCPTYGYRVLFLITWHITSNLRYSTAIHPSERDLRYNSRTKSFPYKRGRSLVFPFSRFFCAFLFAYFPLCALCLCGPGFPVLPLSRLSTSRFIVFQMIFLENGRIIYL